MTRRALATRLATASASNARGGCELCGAVHEVTPADRIGDRGERVSDAEAMMVAHYRLSIAATSAAPFALHGGRAQ